jgi:hypothetical protein
MFKATFETITENGRKYPRGLRFAIVSDYDCGRSTLLGILLISEAGGS